jgi:hypothetical protein
MRCGSTCRRRQRAEAGARHRWRVPACVRRHGPGRPVAAALPDERAMGVALRAPEPTSPT